MKQFFFLLFVALLVACGSDKPAKVVDSVEVSTSEINFTDGAGSRSLYVTSTVDWTASMAPSDASSWLSLNVREGGKGKTTLSISVKANTGDARTAVVTVTAGEAYKTITVSQRKATSLTITTQKEFDFTTTGGTFSVSLQSDATVNVTMSDPWIKQMTGKATNNYTYKVEANDGFVRSGTVIFKTLGGSAADTVKISQAGYSPDDCYADREVVKLASATKGKGVDLVLMGDGFVIKDMVKGDSRYRRAMEQAMEHFFAIEPYKSNSDYFNVYMVAAISNQSGITHDPIGKMVDTRFKSKFDATDANSTRTECDYALVENYATSIPNIDPRKDLSVIVVFNSTKYAGTCSMASDGFSIAMCPMSTLYYPYDFRGLIQHEAGGHGFGRLADEYKTNATQTVPSSDITNARKWQGYGMYLNVDFTNDPTQVLWKDFIGVAKYPQVGLYQGGYYYGYGVWRAEQNNCMIDNIPYYNVYCRYLIAKRIMAIAGESYGIASFMAADNVPVWAGAPPVRSGNPVMPPLAPPVIME